MPDPARDQDVSVRYTYRLETTGEGIYAQCVEVDAEGEGKTRVEAVESLREALRDLLESTEAVAPPSLPGRHHIVLVEADPPPRA